jgi:hypothetical protein
MMDQDRDALPHRDVDLSTSWNRRAAWWATASHAMFDIRRMVTRETSGLQDVIKHSK